MSTTPLTPPPTPPPISLSDAIATAAHTVFASLPKHGKPQVRSNGVPEWTVLACISLLVPSHILAQSSSSNSGDESSSLAPTPVNTDAPSDSPSPLPLIPHNTPSSNSLSRATSPFTSSPRINQSPPPSRPLSSRSWSKSRESPSPSPKPTSFTPDGRAIFPISIGTGVKCLPANRLPPAGDTLHDSHAEVIARRSFVSWLLYEAKQVLRGHSKMRVLEWDGNKFSLKPGIEATLYVSVLPCGDASTLYLAAHQSAEMAAFKANAFDLTPAFTSIHGAAVRGRVGYENYGAIRTKPGRALSFPTTSFSCSDKIASWCALGLQGGMLDRLFEPIYLDHVIVGGIEQEAPDAVKDQVAPGMWRARIQQEIERALWGRLIGIDGCLPPPFHLHKPTVHLSTVPFVSSKEVIAESSFIEPVPAMVSLAQIIPTGQTGEVIINGSKQNGLWKAPGLKALRPPMRTMLSKLELMRSFLDTWDLAFPEKPFGDVTYYELKHPSSSFYQAAKAILRGTPQHIVPDTFSLAFPPTCLTTDASDASGGPSPPFKGWIVVGQAYESFLKDGTTTIDPEELVKRPEVEDKRTRDLREVMEVIATVTETPSSLEALINEAFVKK